MPTRPARLDPARSIDAQDYQDRPRGVTAMAKEFTAGARTGAHSHPRAQLIYAVEGVNARPHPERLLGPAAAARAVGAVRRAARRRHDRRGLDALAVHHADAAQAYWPQCQ